MKRRMYGSTEEADDQVSEVQSHLLPNEAGRGADTQTTAATAAAAAVAWEAANRATDGLGFAVVSAMRAVLR